MEETGKRSSWQTPALSMTSPGELKIMDLRKLCMLYELKRIRMQLEILMASRLNLEYLQLFVLFTLHRVVSVQLKAPPSPLQDPVRFISSAVKSSKPAFLLLSSISLPHLFLNQFPMLYEGIHEFQPLSLSCVQTAVINTSFPDTLPSEGTIDRKDSKKFQDSECLLLYFSEITLLFCVSISEILFSDFKTAQRYILFLFFLPYMYKVLLTLKG